MRLTMTAVNILMV